MGGLFEVFKSTLIEYEIFKIEKTTTTLGHNNRKHYTQVLNLKEKEREKREHIRVVEVYSGNLPTKWCKWYAASCSYIIISSEVKRNLLKV